MRVLQRRALSSCWTTLDSVRTMRAAVRNLIVTFERIGFDPADGTDTGLRKRVLVALTVLVNFAAVLWGFIYLALDEPLAATIPLSYAVLSSLSIAVFALTRRYIFFRASQLTLILLLPFLLMVALGGFVNASAVILWSLIAPLGALLVSGRRAATYWFVAFAALVVISRILQPHVRATNNLSDGVVLLFFVLNIVGVSLVAFVLVHYFVGQRDQAMALLGVEREKSERLLLNVLPKSVAAILKEEQRTIAEHYDAASVLFADIVGFTPLSEELEPEQMVEALNEVFTYFDDLCATYGVEKIRTIGDNYMVASGVPHRRDDHALAIARLALDMRGFVPSGVIVGPERMVFRFGINSGPLVAGVIGNTKFQYDIWGDTVNTASRMESHGVPGKIQITEATYNLIKDDFVCTTRGTVAIKGKGPIVTWFLEDAR